MKPRLIALAVSFMSTPTKHPNRRVFLIILASALFLSALGGPTQTAAQDPFPFSACAGPVGGDPPTLDTTCVTLSQGAAGDNCSNVDCAKILLDSGNVGNVLDTDAGGIPNAAATNKLYWGDGRVLTEKDEGPGKGLDADTVDGYEGASLALPSGAVMAFNLAACPAGWSAFSSAAGRTIVGVGAGSGLTTRTLLETGGAETHALTVAQIPAHSHSIQFNKHFAADGGTGDFGPGPGNTYNTDSTGGGQAFPLMQPYVALLYCEKN